MSTEETKPGALPVESAPSEVNDTKTLERNVDVVPAVEQKETNGSNGTSTEADKEEQVKLSDSEKEDKVIQDAVKQITFYFSDSNLPYDKYLFYQAQNSQKDENAPIGTGWVPLSTVLNFKRMQDIISESARSATICEFAIVNALRAAYPTDDAKAVIEISSDGHDIRRKQPLVEPSQTDQIHRSVYIKGFPDEEGGKKDADDNKSYATSQLQKDLEKFVDSLNVGKVNAVRMRRDDRKAFKGSIFVELATVESAKALGDLDPKPTYPGQSEPIEVMLKKEYVDMKAKEHGFKPQYGNNKPSGPSGTKRPFNAFKDYTRGGTGGNREPRKVTVFVEGSEMEVDTETGKVKNPEEIKYTEGKILKFEGASTSEDVNAYNVKQSLQAIHPPAFVELEKGSSHGIVFFKEPVTEAILKTIQDAGITAGGDENKLTWTTVSGDDEKKYHTDRAHARASIALSNARSDSRGGDDRRSNNNNGRGGGRGGRGGRGRGGGGRGGRGGYSDRDNRDDRRNDRNRERERDSKKRGREEDDGDRRSSPSKKDDEASAKKGNSIAVPQVDSAGPVPPAAKKAKQDD